MAEDTPSNVIAAISTLATDTHSTLSTTTMATSASGRERLYNAKETLNLILDSLSDDESHGIGEPMCPGSDEEFPDQDSDDIW